MHSLISYYKRGGKIINNYKDNNVSQFLFITGIIFIVLGFIGGLVLGTYEESTYFGAESQIIWSVVIVYWFSGFVSGLFFIGLSEIVKLLNKIHQESVWARSKNKDNHSDEPIQATSKNSNLTIKPEDVTNDINWDFTDRYKLGIINNYSTDGKRIDDIRPLPIENYSMVFMKDEVHLVHMDKKRLPIRVEESQIKETPKLNDWYNDNPGLFV